MLSMEALLEKLVAIPSVSGFEGRIAAFIARFCRDQGHVVWEVNGSVAVQIKGLDSRRALIYNGHLDTVPGNWPGALHMAVKDGQLTGLGVTDMKAGLAVMCMLAQVHRYAPPDCDIWLFFSREEETTAQGSLDLADWWVKDFGGLYTKKAVLILEPTGNAYIAFAHKGGGVFRTTVTGRSCHGSTNLAGQMSAIDLACRFGVGLKKTQKRWLRWYQSSRYGPATINMTRVHTVDGAPNVVAEAVELMVDIRTNGILTPDLLTEEFRKMYRKYGIVLPPGDIRGAKVVECRDTRALKQAFRSGWPELPEGIFPAAADMNAFLWSGLPVAIVGPGNESLHQRKENLSQGAMEYLFMRLMLVARAFAGLN